MNKRRVFIPRPRKQREGLRRWRQEQIDRQLESGELVVREATVEERERLGIKPKPADGGSETRGSA